MTAPAVIHSRRGTGRTRQQLLDAPEGTVYIVQHEPMADYVRNLATALGRTDIQVRTANWLRTDQWHGVRIPALRCDHATGLSSREWDAYFRAEFRSEEGRR